MRCVKNWQNALRCDFYRQLSHNIMYLDAIRIYHTYSTIIPLSSRIRRFVVNLLSDDSLEALTKIQSLRVGINDSDLLFTEPQCMRSLCTRIDALKKYSAYISSYPIL